MTGEDMIVKETAKMLREARDDEYASLRLVFWIAGRCEQCGAPHVCDGKMMCRSCGSKIINRAEALPTQQQKENAPIAQWWDVIPPGYGGAFPVLVVANRVVLAWSTYGLFSIFDRWYHARKILEERKFMCTKAPR